MAIAPNLEAGLMKAIRSLEENVEYLSLDKLKDLEKVEVEEMLKKEDKNIPQHSLNVEGYTYFSRDMSISVSSS